MALLSMRSTPNGKPAQAITSRCTRRGLDEWIGWTSWGKLFATISLHDVIAIRLHLVQVPRFFGSTTSLCPPGQRPVGSPCQIRPFEAQRDGPYRPVCPDDRSPACADRPINDDTASRTGNTRQ
jgi:hypothetical protein